MQHEKQAPMFPQDMIDQLEEGVQLAQIARERAIPLRTLSRWVKCYREIGLGGLTRKTRAETIQQWVLVMPFLSIYV